MRYEGQAGWRCSERGREGADGHLGVFIGVHWVGRGLALSKQTGMFRCMLGYLLR